MMPTRGLIRRKGVCREQLLELTRTHATLALAASNAKAVVLGPLQNSHTPLSCCSQYRVDRANTRVNTGSILKSV